MLSQFNESLENKRFVVTSELTPPKGVDISSNLKGLGSLRSVDAINITDQSSSIMRLSPLAFCKILKDRGIEPICQFTCRDRNRIALQSDLLGAYLLGIENILCLTGDPTGTGDHPDAKPVFDISVMELIRAVKQLENGVDLAGNILEGAPKFCIGAVANPGSPLEIEIPRMREKAEAGAKFFQTQAVYDPLTFGTFMESADTLGIPVLVGILVVKSGNMARYLNENVPGINVPQPIVDELDNTSDKIQTSIEVAGRIIREVKEMCQGIHIMTMGMETKVPDILEAGGIVTSIQNN